MKQHLSIETVGITADFGQHFHSAYGADHRAVHRGPETRGCEYLSLLDNARRVSNAQEPLLR